MAVALLVGGQICFHYSGLWIPSSFFSSGGSSSRTEDYSPFPLSSQNESLPGTYEDGDYIASNGFTTVTEAHSTSRFYFSYNNTVEITSINSTILTYHFNFGIENSNLSLNVDTLETVSIDLEKKDTLDDFSRINYDDSSSSFSVSWWFGTLINIRIPNLPYPNSTYDQSSMRLSLENFLSLNPTLTSSDIFPAVWNANQGSWDIIYRDIDGKFLEIPLSHNYGEISDNGEEKEIIFTLFNRITVIPISTEDSPFNFPFFPVIIGLAVLIVSTLALSSEHYRTLIVRTINPNYGMHRLKFGEIFENENRMKIISAVLDEPGIHFNELKRKCDVQTGQLRWHINLLESYGIIQMHKIGQYNTYYPTISENPFSESDVTIIKSKSTLKILKMIEDVPSITASRIAKILGLGRNTVKYHVDKLLEKQLIAITKEGRQLKLSRINKNPFSHEEKGW
jgi:DNA-binding transcriptional ArsR family regulator